MTKAEKRKARKAARAAGQPFEADFALDNQPSSFGASEFGAERNHDGTYNKRRARALERHARLVYEYDRDF